MRWSDRLIQPRAKEPEVRFKEPKVYRDPVHDIISYEREGDLGRLVVTLVDAPEFQRLRFVRQVGLASLVFHGAEHSRFSHSMGVAHVARRMYDQLHPESPVDEPRRVATIVAGLLHDIGHGPFSHAMERVFGFHHEDYSRALICDPDSTICQILQAFDSALPARVAAYISSTAGNHTQDIVSSQLDADRFDYLLRDSHFSGVEVGRYDLERILLMLEHDELGIIVNVRAFESIEGYLLARYHMYRLVYFHKAVRAAETQLRLMFERARELIQMGRVEVDRATALGRMMTGETLSAPVFSQLSEIEAWARIREWSRDDDPHLSELAIGLVERRLFGSLDQRIKTESDMTQILAAEAEILEQLGPGGPYRFAVDVAADIPYSPYNPTSSQPASNHIRIRDRNHRVVAIEELSPIAATLATASYELRRWCYDREFEPLVQRVADSLRLSTQSVGAA